MGCYDTVLVPCPNCGKPYPAQSKSGECLLREFTLENAPEDVMENVNRHAPFLCDCGTSFMIKLEYLPKTKGTVVACQP